MVKFKYCIVILTKLYVIFVYILINSIIYESVRLYVYELYNFARAKFRHSTFETVGFNPCWFLKPKCSCFSQPKFKTFAQLKGRAQYF